MGAEIIILSLLVMALAMGVAIIFFLSMIPFNAWIYAITNNLSISPIELVGMRLRGVDPQTICETMVRSSKAGITISSNDMESHVLCSGNLLRVVDALVSADRAGLDLNYDSACAIDLAGRDVLEAVSICINPITDSFRATGIAKDGIQLHVKVKLTLKAEISRLIGGMTERTIQARVIQGVISTIGSAESHSEILRAPSKIADNLLAAGLDMGTAFSIISIDIEDIDVGKNIGAHLKTATAIASKQVSQAKAEGKRAMAVAAEYEARARSTQMQAKFILNQSLVPKALEKAYNHGQLVVKRKKKPEQQIQFT
ncbi:flotillin-like FloA family protein [Candidatus Riflebacteria bacterium]